MILKIESTIDDIIAYRSYVYDTSDKIQSRIRKYQTIFILYTLLFSFLLYYNNSSLTLFLLIFSIIFLIKLLFFNKILYLKNIRKTLLMHKPEMADTTLVKIELFDGFLTITDREIESKFHIKSIEKISQGTSYTFLIFDELRAVCIPINKVIEGNLHDFIKILKEKIDGKS